MNNGYQETSPNVFQSGWFENENDWKIVDQITRERKRPVAIINMMNERNEAPKVLWPPAWCILWFNLPDSRLDFSEIETSPKDYFMGVGKTIKALYEANYLIWIQCAAGHSRSTAANIVFRMMTFGERRDQALEKIKEMRPTITTGPNEHFMEILAEIEKDLFPKSKTRIKKEKK